MYPTIDLSVTNIGNGHKQRDFQLIFNTQIFICDSIVSNGIKVSYLTYLLYLSIYPFCPAWAHSYIFVATTNNFPITTGVCVLKCLSHVAKISLSHECLRFH